LNTAILTFEVVPVETAGQELLALAGFRRCMCGIRHVGGTAARGMDRTPAKRDLAKRSAGI
jgi:hypothetical protein